MLLWTVVMKPCFMTCLIILLIALLISKKNLISKKCLRWSTFFIMLFTILIISGIRVYSYLNPSLATDPGHENYSAHFNDVQSVQIKAARKYGIEPIKDRSEAEKAIDNHALVHLRSCKNYQLAPMGHSIPYLTKNGADILNTIGQNFRDSLASKKLAPHKMVVTSVLRTDKDVENLMKHNKVAVKNSAHRYATTFDISYTNFINDGLAASTDRNVLKKVLAEVLRDLRDDKQLYVKYERSQNCFHITVRK